MMKSKALKKIITKIIILIFIALIAFDSRLKIAEYKIDSPKLSAPVRIALITDLHSCRYGENQEKLLSKLNSCQPDIVLLGGDIFDDVMPDDNAHILVKECARRYKTYYVSGNHEWWSGRMAEIFTLITSCGAEILRGESISLDINGQKITLSGIDDPDSTDIKHPAWKTQLSSVGESLSAKKYNILLTHRPENGELYAQYGFDLALSGHAHGGQWRIPFLLNGLYAPNQGFFPKLAGGMYDFDGNKLIVSRGLSRENTSIPRIFNRPELVFITVE